jgi:ribosome-binding protein aMBF1 (putative translation factor)
MLVQTMGKLVSSKSYLDQKYGKEGSEGRSSFKEKAYVYYLSEILRNRRKELNLSQEDLAQRIGKQRPYISRVENGEDVRLSNFLHIAAALGLDIMLHPK